MKRFAEAGCGAVSSRPFHYSLEGKSGTQESPPAHGALLNAEGAPNIGVEAFSGQMKNKSQFRIPRSSSAVVGKTIEEFISMAVEAEKMGADIIDLDITCRMSQTRGGSIPGRKTSFDRDPRERSQEGRQGPALDQIHFRLRKPALNCKDPEKAGADAVVPL